MASRKDWESYKNVVEDLTNCGVEKQSWGKRLNVNKDLHESFEKARHREKKFDGDIAGFSSSDEDDETSSTGFTSASRLAAKRALIARKTSSKKPKRQKKYDDENYNSPLKQFPQTTFAIQPHTTPSTSLGITNAAPSRTPTYSTTPAYSRTSTPDTSSTSTPNKASILAPNKTPAPSRTPAYSRTPVPSRTPTPGTSSNKRSNLGAGRWKLFPNRFESSFASESPSLSRPISVQEDINDDITWSESDSSDKEISSIDETESPAGVPEDKIPLSTQSVKQQQESQGSGNIGEYESDSESFTKHLDIKESSPSISPNTPTPTPTPCTPPKEGEACPPPDSTKKGKRKYLRNGLAERLQKLTMQENCNRSFWRHKRNEQNDDDSPSSSAEGTLIVRVMSENLDHSVYILTCHVLSQDIEPFLPKHVTILLESDRRKHLDMNITSTCLRIYSPWKLLHLPESSGPVLMCMAHCERIPSLDLISEDISDPSDDQQTQSEVTLPTFVDEKIDEIRQNSDMENEEDQDEGMNETVVEWDSFGYEGVSMTTRVNVTARIQRIYWRNLETRDDHMNSASSLTVSIIQNAKILNKEKRMSLCFLAQGGTSVCCEVQLHEDILFNRTDWHDALCHSEGTVLCFSKLRLVEHRNRKRARQLFSLIDSLKTTRSGKQQSCFVFRLDDQSTVQIVSEDKVSDYLNYSSPQSLNDLNSDNNNHRVSFCGKLLHAKFSNDKYYNTKHVRLWLSGKIIPQECKESDVTPEPTISVTQVCYSSGRTVEWNESTLSAGQLLSMQDLVFDKVKPAILTADIFSKIQVVIPQSSRPDDDDASRDIHEIWRRTMTATMTDEQYTSLKSLPVAVLPDLNENCEGGDCLVMCEVQPLSQGLPKVLPMDDHITELPKCRPSGRTLRTRSVRDWGIISDVDHENAFCWYSCCHCASEDISEISNSGSQYHCNACALEFTSPVTNIHLEIYLTSASTSAFKVKVKLLQKTTKQLLSGSEKTNRETYNVNSVLNKHLGPIHCYIAERIQDKTLKISFKLEELDSSSWDK